MDSTWGWFGIDYRIITTAIYRQHWAWYDLRPVSFSCCLQDHQGRTAERRHLDLSSAGLLPSSGSPVALCTGSAGRPPAPGHWMDWDGNWTLTKPGTGEKRQIKNLAYHMSLSLVQITLHPTEWCWSVFFVDACLRLVLKWFNVPWSHICWPLQALNQHFIRVEVFVGRETSQTGEGGRTDRLWWKTSQEQLAPSRHSCKHTPWESGFPLTPPFSKLLYVSSPGNSWEINISLNVEAWACYPSCGYDGTCPSIFYFFIYCFPFYKAQHETWGVFHHNITAK